jgi:Ni,Fe-hydrogenase III small subunit
MKGVSDFDPRVIVGYLGGKRPDPRVIVGYGACDSRIFCPDPRVIVGYGACDSRIF